MLRSGDSVVDYFLEIIEEGGGTLNVEHCEEVVPGMVSDGHGVPEGYAGISHPRPHTGSYPRPRGGVSHQYGVGFNGTHGNGVPNGEVLAAKVGMNKIEIE